jgi:NTE family protein
MAIKRAAASAPSTSSNLELAGPHGQLTSWAGNFLGRQRGVKRMNVGASATGAGRLPHDADNSRKVGLVLQGGGALGAYQAGVYQALHEVGIEPDWVAGVSIGAINSAIIAGNPPERRVARLREFWELITSRDMWGFTLDGDDARKARNAYSAAMTMAQGQPGFFKPNVPGPAFAPRGSKQATAYYDTAPLRETLVRLVDFDLINSQAMRFAVGAVNIGNGNFTYFDNAGSVIIPEHVMASGALPPALPMVRIGTDWFWDGGLVSNTPLQHLLDNLEQCDMLVFQVDLFSARGTIPRDIAEVLARQKDIQYSSRTRLISDRYMQQFHQDSLLRSLLQRMPAADLTDDERQLKHRLERQARVTLLQLIYQQAAYEGEAKDYEFSGASMREHWENGQRDTERTLRRRDWLIPPEDGIGIVVHDVHRADD